MSVYVRKMTLEDVRVVVQLDQMSFSLPWPERSAGGARPSNFVAVLRDPAWHSHVGVASFD